MAEELKAVDASATTADAYSDTVFSRPEMASGIEISGWI